LHGAGSTWRTHARFPRLARLSSRSQPAVRRGRSRWALGGRAAGRFMHLAKP
jgi:hypothetical protein